ncbi:MAG TPA: efflux RND transporter periplasmic adaptor subunit [Opitutaceae bacterium]|nr:efflux RND transporter periplasmic adaptor subunit [Opitutaceae bacterium]
MKPIFLLCLALLPLPALRAADAAPHLYQCPMHPWIHSDHPGKCTICGMSLVAMDPAGSVASTVTLRPDQVASLGVATTPVGRGPLVRTLRVNGQIDDDDTRHRILAARIPGRVDQLFVNAVGAEVVAGAPLATIYSPDVLTAERVFVERLKAGEAAFPAADRAAARERLFELGLTEPEIHALETTQQPSATLTVRAPLAGTVVSKSVYEGQYVTASDRLFEIADFSSMWFLFDAYEQDIPWLSVGQSVEVTTGAVPGETIRAPIAFIDPNFDEGTRTTKVRVVIPNPHFNLEGEHHRLPHRVPAEGKVKIETAAVLLAPRSAVLDAGDGPVAYVDHGDRTYEQRRLRLGRRGDDQVEVLAGLQEGERVVTQGALLIDAQARLAPPAAGAAEPAAPARPNQP